MAWFGRQTQEERVVKALTSALEARGISLENPAISLADPRAYEALFGAWNSAAGVDVTVEAALGVPAVWAAVNFLAGTIAALPLILYRKDAKGRSRADKDPLYAVLHDKVNEDGLTSFAWRKNAMASVLTEGRSVSFIERNAANRVMNLWPLDQRQVTVVRQNGRRIYQYRENGRLTEYQASEVIDLTFLQMPDGVKAYNPVSMLKDALGLAIALEQYASKFFRNGGVPPLSLQGNFASPKGASRAANDVLSAVQRANDEQRNVLTMPTGYELKPIGISPEAGQLVEARRFQLEEIARIYQLPPVFLQDLTRGTFSNTEQQDLHLTKHTLVQWLEMIEQELNAKLFPASNRRNFVEFNVDGLLRGDFKTRIEAYAQAINTAQMAPDEVRALENRPEMGGDAAKLHIQGATVPLGTQAQTNPQPTQTADPTVDDTGADDA